MPKTKTNAEAMTAIGIKISLYKRIIDLSQSTGKKIFFLVDEAIQLLEKKYERDDTIM